MLAVVEYQRATGDRQFEAALLRWRRGLCLFYTEQLWPQLPMNGNGMVWRTLAELTEWSEQVAVGASNATAAAGGVGALASDAVWTRYVRQFDDFMVANPAFKGRWSSDAVRAAVVRHRATRSRQLLNFVQKGIVGFVRGVHPRMQPDALGMLSQVHHGRPRSAVTPPNPPDPIQRTRWASIGRHAGLLRSCCRCTMGVLCCSQHTFLAVISSHCIAPQRQPFVCALRPARLCRGLLPQFTCGVPLEGAIPAAALLRDAPLRSYALRHMEKDIVSFQVRRAPPTRAAVDIGINDSGLSSSGDGEVARYAPPHRGFLGQLHALLTLQPPVPEGEDRARQLTARTSLEPAKLFDSVHGAFFNLSPYRGAQSSLVPEVAQR